MQVIQTKKFIGKFVRPNSDENDQEYDLSKITTPIALYYVPEDIVVPAADVQQLKTKLPNVAEQQQFQELSNNIDFLYAKNVETFVFNKVVKFLRA